MIKKAFFGSTSPRLEYTILQQSDLQPEYIRPSEKLVFHLKKHNGAEEKALLEKGEMISIGQKIKPAGNVEYCLSPCAGRISDISDYKGMIGAEFCRITVEIDSSAEIPDDDFSQNCHTPTLENGKTFFKGLPGKPDFTVFSDPEQPIQTIAILGIDDELLCITNQFFVQNDPERIKTGIDILGDLTGIDDIVLCIPRQLKTKAESTGAAIMIIDNDYPNANRELISRQLSSGNDLNQNIAFFSAETVSTLAELGSAKPELLHKTMTVVSKSGDTHIVSAPIGLPVRDILHYLDETVDSGDRVIIGGPMHGTAIYSVDVPIMADTDILMVQSEQDIVTSDDVSCFNCGACVRACPAHIQVNNLIRLLDNGMYQEAAEEYHLFSCIDCALCSYVCEARIAVFHHIKLAKQALEGTETYERYA
ncbi:MAG: hypothetical protein CSA26_06825 [Desulfobacterales bacterium]|nr:MAG: hypothetical protein CSA26_06825 [Desulfobacterales bacterium]